MKLWNRFKDWLKWLDLWQILSPDLPPTRREWAYNG